jgi:hypothetical protein
MNYFGSACQYTKESREATNSIDSFSTIHLSYQQLHLDLQQQDQLSWERSGQFIHYTISEVQYKMRRLRREPSSLNLHKAYSFGK